MEEFVGFCIDRDTCVGCGLCVEMAPDFFAMGEFHARVTKQPQNEEDLALLMDIRRDCPVGAILLKKSSEET
ncbi:MAG: ferredoxin [Spirochaetales bacterium]|nr:ferredoxin [Spirochaetales bacterium]